MLTTILKIMYGASKSIPVPEGMHLQIDAYRSVHLTLSAGISLPTF